MWSAGPGDDQARFLADLRALRDLAAIEYDELAARAHYPSDVLKEAENGPLLPGLPILTAYVRACDGDVPDWEERWRRLTSEIPEDPDLPVRPAGASAAAVAGARAGVGIAPPEVYDPERIKAALRGGHARSGQGGQGTGGRNGSQDADARSTVASGWSTAPSWDASSDESIATANGNLTETSWSREPFDPAVRPKPAESVEQIERFRWLPDEESAFSAGDTGPADTGPAHTGPGGTGPAGPGPADPPTAAPPDAEPSVIEWTPRWDEAAKPAEGTDFWSTSAADLQQPAASPQIDEQSYPDTSWSAPAWTPAPSPPRPAQSAPGAARSPLASESAPNAGVGAATATQPRTSAGSVGTPASAGSAASVASAGFPAAQTSTHEAAAHQKDRSFPTQLLVIIIIAALIGSALVLLIK